MSSLFSRILTTQCIKELADDRSYQRGSNYFRQGRVHSLVENGDVIAAQVEGTETYDVELWIEDEDQLGYQCDCPVGLEDWFCKHCVGVGLTWLAKPPTPNKPSKTKSQPAVATIQDVQQYLEQQEPASLIKLILDRAAKDPDWRDQLVMKVAAAQSKGIDLAPFQKALKKAIGTRDYVDYYEVHNYTRGIGKVIDTIATLLEEGHPQAVIELCEYALPLLERALNSVDDSNGYLGDLLEEVQELHLNACVQAKPDPIALAQRLLEYELTSEFGSFSGAATTYADVLGKPGLTCYQKLAEAAWAEGSSSNPSQRTSFYSNQRRLSNILETLARQSGDIEAVVAIKERDLSSSYTYLEIAQLYQENGQADKALQWAEKGLRRFPDRPDMRLRDFVVQEYQQRGRFAEAIALVWVEFTELPNLRSYQKLKTAADRGSQWQNWRDRAIAYIRLQIKNTQQKKQGLFSHTYRDHSLLVELFLWEKEIELAWREAKAGGCSKQLWLTLADQRQQTHPEESLSIYMPQIEPLIQQTNNTAYAQAVDFVKKVKSLMVALDLRSQFDEYVAHLRSTYKAKRNFIALLNKESL